MRTLLQRFTKLPRAVQWLVIFLVAVVAYFVVIEPLLDRTANLVAAADSAEAALDREQSLAADWSNPARPLAAARAAFGTPALPGTATDRTAALITRVNAILNAHHIRAEVAQKQVSLGAEQAAALAQPGERIDRLILDLSFEADPATVAAVLADLERSEEVTAVSRVAIRRADSRAAHSESGAEATVRAELAAEAWVRTLPSAAPGGTPLMPDGLSWHKLKAIAAGPRRLGLMALAVVLLTLGFALLRAWPLVRVLAFGAPVAAPDRSVADNPALATDLKLYTDRITGRSLFFTPRPPPPPRNDTADSRTPDPTPTKPSRYAGPAVIAMINDTVWFADGVRLHTGDPAHGSGNLKVLEISPPWAARVEWEGVEFTVTLFDRSPLLSAAADTGAPPVTPEPAPSPVKPAPTPPPAEPGGAPTPAPPGDPPPSEPPSAEPPGSEPPAPAPEPAPATPPSTDTTGSETR